MNTNREKTSSVMGIVVSVLLHAIFLAGCVAFSFNIHSDGSTGKAEKSEVAKVSAHTENAKLKS